MQIQKFFHLQQAFFANQFCFTNKNPDIKPVTVEHPKTTAKLTKPIKQPDKNKLIKLPKTERKPNKRL